MRYEIIIKPWNQNKLGTIIIINQIFKVKSRKKKKNPKNMTQVNLYQLSEKKKKEEA